MPEFEVETTVEATLRETWIVEARDEEAARALFASGAGFLGAQFDGQVETDHEETRLVVAVKRRR